MEISNEQRDNAFEKATEQQRFLYADPESGSRLLTISSKYGLSERDVYFKFAVLVGDVILGLRSRSELPSELSKTLGIDTEKAVRITGDLIDFIDHPEKNIESNLQKEGVKPVIENSSVTESDKLTTDIIEAEATLKAIPQVRTMASDMKQTENTYSSTQDSILR